MLDDDERAAFLQSIERVRCSVAAHLDRCRDVSLAVDFVANLHRAVDKVVGDAAERGATTDCKAGCAYCCSVRVEAGEAEIFRIARHVRTLPAPRVDTLLERLRRHVAESDANADADATAKATRIRRIDCAFLENNLCSIYDVRPAVCRKAHSLSVQQCREFSPVIPQHLQIIAGAEALMRGTAEGYRQRRLPASAHALCKAVLQALTDATLEAKWYKGESVFPDDDTAGGR